MPGGLGTSDRPWMDQTFFHPIGLRKVPARMSALHSRVSLFENRLKSHALLSKFGYVFDGTHETPSLVDLARSLG